MAEFQIPTQGGTPFGVTAGPDGAVWFTEETGKIGRVPLAPTPRQSRRPLILELGRQHRLPPFILSGSGNVFHCPDGDPHSHQNLDPDTDSDIDANQDCNQDRDRYEDIDADSDEDSHSNSDANADRGRDRDRNGRHGY